MNPCNIRKGDKWQGMRKTQTDNAFVQFESMAMGLRAAFKTLKNYRDLYHIYSIKGIIYRWAPPQDGNNTEYYIKFVEENTGISRHRSLTSLDYMKVVKAMCKIESNYTPKDDELTKAFYMVFGIKPPLTPPVGENAIRSEFYPLQDGLVLGYVPCSCYQAARHPLWGMGGFLSRAREWWQTQSTSRTPPSIVSGGRMTRS